MQEEKKSVEKQIIEERQKLDKCANMAESVTILSKLSVLLEQVDIAQIGNLDQFLNENMRPISREITNTNLLLYGESKEKLQSALLGIVVLYSKAAKLCLNINSFQFLQQLLSRYSDIFREQSLDKGTQNQDLEWITLSIPKSQRRNFFFYQSLNTMMNILSQIQEVYPHTNITFIKNYFTLISFLQNYLRKTKLQECIQRSVESIERIVLNCFEYKEFSKDLTFDLFEQFSVVISKLLKYSNALQLKKRAEMLGAMYGLGMLKNPAIEKKITGLKTINKWAIHFYGTIMSSVKEEDFCQWIVNNQVLDIILQDPSSTTMVKSSTDILRLFFRKKCLNLDNLCSIMDYTEKACPENRQMIFKYMDMESIRLEYREYQYLLERFSTLKNADYYEEQMFMLLGQVIKYSASNMLKLASQIHGNILRTYMSKFRNQRIQYKCIKNLVRTIIKLIEKQQQSEGKVALLLEMYDTYFKEPNRLGIIIIKYIIDDLPELAYFSKSKAVSVIIQEKPIIKQALAVFKDENSDAGFKFDLDELLCSMLKILKDSSYSKINFDEEILFQATACPKIFQNLIKFLPYSSHFQDLFDSLVRKFNVEKFSFSCLRYFFYRISILYINQINTHYADDQYQISCAANTLKGFDNMKYLMLNTEDQMIREEISRFLAELFTSYNQSRSQSGEQQLIEEMKLTKGMLLKQFQKFKKGDQENVCRLKGYLAYVEALMKATETLGVGDLKAHNSLVPTSTVKIRIFNEVTYGNDVLTIFQKKVSSNLTLFSLIEELSRQFKCSAYQIMLREGTTIWPQSLNGLTLQETKIDGKTLTAVKSYRERIRKQPLIVNQQISPKARAAFEQIYNYYAPNGKMGKKECSKYVSGVTNTSCSVEDTRVVDFFKEYDTDNDSNITFDDFLRFYKYNAISSSRDEVVWRNLSNMRYRKDLKKFDQPIEGPHHQLLFRYYLAEAEVYNTLQELSHCSIKQIQQRAITLLFRLPTNQQAIEALSSDLGFMQKNSFEIQYILIAIQSHLTQPNQEQKKKNIKQFIESGNSIKIFDMILKIDSLENATKDQMKCLFISLKILRSLVNVPSLRNHLDPNLQINNLLDLPENNLFVKMVKNSLLQMDFEILECSLALQLTQYDSNSFNIALQGVFQEEAEIRKISSNYIFILYCFGRVKINLFEVQAKNNAQFWFQMLVRIINYDKNLNFQQILHKSLVKLDRISQDIQKNPEDQTIYGNLSIIYHIIQKYKDLISIPQTFILDIINLAKRVISVQNRKIIYSILSTQDLTMTINYIKELLDSISPMKEVSPKKFHVGLKNLGSTCYMNSILQVLFIIREFRNLIFDLKNEKASLEHTEVNGKLIYDNVLFQLQKMYAYLQKSNRAYFQPEDFCLTIKDPMNGKPINPRIQEDAHQFVGNFLDKIQKYSQKSDKFEIFKRLVIGKTLTQFTCEICSNKISREQNFCQLPLQVKNFSNIKESLQKFTQVESISDYFCDVCQKKVEKIQKSTWLSQLPEIMIINLQRIIFDLETFQKVKVDSAFNFPESFNFYDFVSKDKVKSTPDDYEYVLRGIVVHSGTSQSGHYYSIIQDNKQWYKFNDQTVSKFDMKDLARQAYGGTQSQQNWNDDLKFSTNAYILFYEKRNVKKQIISQVMQNEIQEMTDGNIELVTNMSPNCEEHNFEKSLNTVFESQIEVDNVTLFKQLQVHQQSIFEFSFEIYEFYRPAEIQQAIKHSAFNEDWNLHPSLTTFENIYSLMRRLLEFSKIFYHVKNQTLFKLGNYLYQLFYILPEKTYQFLNQLTVEQCIDNLCLHNDDTIRNIFKCLLNKSMHVFNLYYQVDFESQEEGIAHFRTLIEGMFNFFSDERLFKNNYKIIHFFEFWKANCELIPLIFNYCKKNELLVLAIDVLMGNDSPLLAEKQQKTKRQEIPQYQSFPLIQIIILMMNGKKNLLDQISPDLMMQGQFYVELTEKQKLMVSNIKFYKKMIESKSDQYGLLAAVTMKLCYKDIEFSKKMVSMFLKGLNSSYDQVQSSLIMINHLKYYLMIRDQLTELRLKWVLGIPQLEFCQDVNYGLKYQDQSLAYHYVSPLFFIQSDQYQPALHVLSMKCTIFSLFSVSGIILLLELLCYSEHCFRYIMSMPAPNYMYDSYIGWIQEYISKLKDEESYYIQFNKNQYYDKLAQLYQMFKEKLNNCPQIQLPVNKKIIGKNKQYQMRASVETQNYIMALWEHQTYVLDNQPIGGANKSLPKQLFKFGNPSGFAKQFVSTQKHGVAEMQEQSLNQFNIPVQWTMLTLHLETKCNLLLKFNFQNFKEEIYTEKGKVFINFPYEQFEGALTDMITCEILQQKVQELPPIPEFSLIPMPEEIKVHSDNFERLDKSCPVCTFINVYGSACEMCGSPL